MKILSIIIALNKKEAIIKYLKFQNTYMESKINIKKKSHI